MTTHNDVFFPSYYSHTLAREVAQRVLDGTLHSKNLHHIFNQLPPDYHLVLMKTPPSRDLAPLYEYGNSLGQNRLGDIARRYAHTLFNERPVEPCINKNGPNCGHVVRHDLIVTCASLLPAHFCEMISGMIADAMKAGALHTQYGK